MPPSLTRRAQSYGGKRVIGPFKPFTAVIGPNGAGKSNLMDGISFVVGLNSRDLRGKQLKDLIYRAQGDTGDEERSASVAMIYERDGKLTSFKRAISASGVGEYRIDGKLTKADTYFARLKALGIHTRAHLGFLVFQGYVSELAAKCARPPAPGARVCSGAPWPPARQTETSRHLSHAPACACAYSHSPPTCSFIVQVSDGAHSPH